MRGERVTEVNGKAERPGDYVLYWMQAAVRAEDNAALDWAASQADRLRLPLAVLFCLIPDYPSAGPHHYRFLLGGIREAAAGLKLKGIRFFLGRGSPDRLVPMAATRAALAVADCGPLRVPRAWLAAAAAAAECRFAHVEVNAVVPPSVVSLKEEWSAYTLRRRIMPIVDGFLEPHEERTPRRSEPGSFLPDTVPLIPDGEMVALEAAPPGCLPPRGNEQRIAERPGHRAAEMAFDAFVERRLDRYDADRGDPTKDGTSNMSAALHFGHISPATLVRKVLAATGQRFAVDCAHPSAAAYIEELVVRRELSVNFVLHRTDYDRYSCLPDWALRTLAEGADHRREAVYTFEQFEAAATHDPYWNAAQDQMVLTGRMHGYMRMYWGKGLLAWSPTPEQAYRTAVALNDRYSLDGRDPNGYAGIAWCFGKHDRPWTGRPVFGTVRYMNANGLKRKFDADAYAASIQALKEQQCSTI